MALADDTAGTLKAELARMSSLNPFEALGLGVDADGAAVRRAYLDATKRLHPNRFAREGHEVQALATEVFLVVRRAYDQLVDDAKRKTLRERHTVKAAPPPRVRSTTPLAVPVAPKPAPDVGPMPTARTSSPALPPPTGVAPAAKVKPIDPPKPAPGAAAAPAAPVKPKPTAPPVAARSGPPVAARTRPPLAPPPTPAGPPAPGPPTQTAAQRANVEAMLEAAKTRNQRFDDAVKLLTMGSYREAREALYKIAAEDTQTRKYRVYLHLAWGMEHRAARRLDEAQRELERALALDPERTEAADELRKIAEARGKGGLFSRLFGR